MNHLQKEISGILEHGKRVGTPWFQMVFRLSSHGRFIVITGKKAGNAVVRNRIRRRLKEIVRKYEVLEKIGADVILLGKRRCAKEEFSVLKSAVFQSLEGIGRAE